MSKTFLMERISWIGMFLFGQCLLLLIAYLDLSIPFQPVLYIVFLSTILFIIFLIIRYHKETAFFKRLHDWESSLDVSGVADAASPFEKIMELALINQTEQLHQSASRQQIALEQEKDELLSWIHEVKTPLTAMHLMISRVENDPMRASLTFEWLRIHHLLDQQLHQLRLPSIENDLYIEKVDIESLLYMELKSLQSWCIQKGMGFDVQLDVTETLSDAKWLAFILRQILTNAVKYSDKPASDIIVRSFVAQERTMIEITDSGRGIAPKDLPRIFDKGFTSTTWHQDSAATGMGLYLAQKAAHTLHIQLTVQSEVGVGSTFTLIFPQPNELLRITGM
ncbi:sensor histidine kinase [Paenibacillus qinlingensis]|uniref:histidine kinase n=1 Tax=Paenibacillus qinlingensis TaxID=1837343 RepID=A0ABU1P9A6_9BACL|nr:sensor histidine kinase [Paenibacillus qinlingensis]MDR6555637.1 OmpR family two-component system bacitracin resistance sensor histidine kinase BceS [Paenibacillus qinlingensis]